MKYVLFGTGDYYKRFSHWFKDCDVVAILDNDEKKQGGLLDGYPVVTPASILDYEYDAVVILSFYVSEMKKQLIELGVDEDKIYHFYDLHELFKRQGADNSDGLCKKTVLLLSHDLTNGGPALALYHGARALIGHGYEVVFASMLDGELRSKLEESFIPVVIDNRLQIGTMKELPWTHHYDLIICNTINYHIFLSDRDISIPVMWWLHDSPFFYEGIKRGNLENIDTTNMKLFSVGPVPRKAMQQYKPECVINDLIYGVSEDV